MSDKKRSLADILAEKKAAALAAQQERKDIEARMEELESAPIPQIAASIEPQNPTTPAKNSPLAEILRAKMLAAKNSGHAEGIGSPTTPPSTAPITAPITAPTAKTTLVETAEALEEQIEGEYDGAFSLNITLNEKQLMAKELAFAGKSFCLVGAAGTGKTTAQREVAAALLQSGMLRTHTFKIQGTTARVEAPSIAFVAFTRVASGNLRRAIHKNPDLERAFTHNITTIHNLLEYEPETYWDYEENKEKFRFTPKRTAANPLDITHLVIEEASMVGLDLWDKLYAALRPGVQIIFIGDINQLPPVFGDAILNYALVQLPVIELTEVYRQKGDSAILSNAHSILEGKGVTEAPDFRIVRGGTTNHTQAKLATSLGLTFPKWAAAGEYDPIQDIILSPWNKRDLGTDNMNKWIAQFLGTERKAVVHEVIAGINKLYLAEGDKVMYNKQVGVITKIAVNGNYMGRAPLPASVNLNRFGTYTGGEEESIEDLDSMDYSNLNLDKMLEDEEGDRTKQASHLVTILLDDGIETELVATGDFSPSSFSLAYALTVHKAQGCEWRKVYIILHRDHSVSLCRELLYTAVTRAREQLVLIAKDDVIDKAIKTQRIKGNNTAEKIEYFNSGIKLNNVVYCTK